MQIRLLNTKAAVAIEWSKLYSEIRSAMGRWLRVPGKQPEFQHLLSATDEFWADDSGLSAALTAYNRKPGKGGSVYERFVDELYSYLEESYGNVQSYFKNRLNHAPGYKEGASPVWINAQAKASTLDNVISSIADEVLGLKAKVKHAALAPLATPKPKASPKPSYNQAAHLASVLKSLLGLGKKLSPHKWAAGVLAEIKKLPAKNPSTGQLQKLAEVMRAAVGVKGAGGLLLQEIYAASQDMGSLVDVRKWFDIAGLEDPSDVEDVWESVSDFLSDVWHDAPNRKPAQNQAYRKAASGIEAMLSICSSYEALYDYLNPL